MQEIFSDLRIGTIADNFSKVTLGRGETRIIPVNLLDYVSSGINQFLGYDIMRETRNATFTIIVFKALCNRALA